MSAVRVRVNPFILLLSLDPGKIGLATAEHVTVRAIIVVCLSVYLYWLFSR